MIALLRGAGISGWQPHHRVLGYEVDVAFAEHRVAVDVDGWAFHNDANAFQKDRRRQNARVDHPAVHLAGPHLPA